MPASSDSSTTPLVLRGWIVTAAATSIGLALGNLYAWSVIKASIPDAWAWSNADKALPYSAACLVFALTMIPAGWLQDRIGPRWICTIGGLLTGLGCIVAGLGGGSLTAFVLGFGGLAGVGIGFGYSAMTPAAIKWFPPQRTGLIAGLVVAGFGLAPVYIAPLATFLLTAFQRTNESGVIEKGVPQTMIALGLGVLVVVTGLAQLVRNPPRATAVQTSSPGAEAQSKDLPWRDMLKTGRFWLLWVMYFCGSAAGLTFISVAQDLGKRSLGEWAFLTVVVLALGNASGRILAGSLSDRFGRAWTMFGEFAFQGIVVATLYFLTSSTSTTWLFILMVVFFLGMNYGSNLALFPAATKDFFGLRAFGMNYGLLFTAWGLAGLVMPWINGLVVDLTGGNEVSYAIIVAMMAASAFLALISRRTPPPAR